jgi:patatin-like phospholipase
VSASSTEESVSTFLLTGDVLAEEAAAIHGEKAAASHGKSADTGAAARGPRHHTRGVKLGVGGGDDESCEKTEEESRKFYQNLNKNESAALCLSGGGIRSAAFSLGVIQALASHQLPQQPPDKDDPKPGNSLLAHFHYLSTVSGGGYIGGWLSAWRLHAKSFAPVWRNLVRRPCGPDVEPGTISWLRSYSNYLTPKLGALSGDTWAVIAIYLRNLILNWLVIIPAACIVLLFIKLLAVISIGLAHERPHGWLAAVFAVWGALFLIVVLASVTRFRPTRRPAHDPGITQERFLWSMLLPAILSAAGFVMLGVTNSGLALLDHHGMLLVIGLSALAGAVVYALGWISGARRYRERDFGAWMLSGLVYGALLGVGAYAYNQAPVEAYLLFNDLLLPVIFGVPWVIASQMIAEMIFVALTSYQRNSDSDREWLARTAGWYLLAALAWLVGTLLIFAGSLMAEGLVHGVEKWLAPLGGISGALSAWIGKSPWSGGRGEQGEISKYWSDITLAVAAPLFVAALIVFLSAGLDWLMFDGTALAISLRFPGTEIFTPTWWTVVFRVLGALAVAALIAWVASWTVNINRFSLHAFYRNRLVRAFLGASRPRRHPDDFTDFDEEDNPRVHKLWPERPKDRAEWRPFHVINMALNIVSTRHLSWQQRKAESFTVSPLHAGSACKAYRRSNEYGDKHGISLGTAVAISGAAASPNMGYHSSPGITLLLALFNVRLGWWLGNPGPEGEDTYRREGPRYALLPLIQETFGLTTDERAYVYLSDGGHFENLGIYEMVRRRCRFILAVDAGADPDYGFEDLGNAQRKIEIDLGVRIEFYGLDKLKKRPADGSNIGPGQPYHAFGVIDYQGADGKESKQGYILYLKAGYHGVEGPGVCSYAIAHPTFPHEATANQFFTESQFESYRALGFTIADELFREAFSGPDPKPATLKDLFTTIQTQLQGKNKP